MVIVVPCTRYWLELSHIEVLGTVFIIGNFLKLIIMSSESLGWQESPYAVKVNVTDPLSISACVGV